MSTWKTREETYHGSKWGYVVVAIVIAIVLALLSSIFFLVGEGLRNIEINDQTIFTYSVGGAVVVIIVIVLLALLIKVGIIALSAVTGVFMLIHKLLMIIWTLFSNIYLLVLTVILVVILILALSVAVYSSVEIDLANPVIIGILIVLLIIFFPFAIFLIDQFSWEHD